MERLTHKSRSEAGYKANRDVPVWECIDKLGHLEDLQEQGRLPELPCAVGDTVYDVVQCNDGKHRIFQMRVGDISPFGSVRKGKVWNMYLENAYFKAYRSFYDIGKTVFLTRKEAEEALERMEDVK